MVMEKIRFIGSQRVAVDGKPVDAEPVDVVREHDLWEKLNTVRNHVYTEIQFKAGVYVTEVFFKNQSGSSVFARASHRDRLQSMVDCLQEIERLW